MASVTFKRGTRAEIEATAKQDGQILMETDQNKKNKMYIDLPDGSRVLIGNSGEAIDTSYDNTTSGLDATNVQSAIDELNSNLSKKVTGYYSSGVLNNCKIGYQTIVLDFSTSEKLKTFSIESDIKILLDVITSLSTGFTTLKPIVAIQSIDNENKTFTVAYSADAEFTINVHCLLFGA